MNLKIKRREVLMSELNTDSSFSYTYSAKEQEELKKIREKYTSPPESCDKLARLRKLDASVTATAQLVAIVIGIIGALVLGFGMSLCMTELGEVLRLPEDSYMIIGIVFGVVGAILACLAYPIYNAIVKIKRRRIAPEIISLTDELLK